MGNPYVMWIYCIRNDITDTLYIGQTKYDDVETRWNEHRAALRKGKHFNVYLQRAWTKHGELAFTFETVAWHTNEAELNASEASYIRRLSAGGILLYNLTEGGAMRLNEAGRLNHKQATSTPEFKAKISKIHSGKIITEEHRQRLREANTGRKQSEETKKKRSQSMLGKKLPPCREETKEKLRQINLGKKYGPMSEEQKEKLRQSNLGKKMSPESIAKMVAANTGKKRRPHTEETKEKMRQAALNRSGKKDV